MGPMGYGYAEAEGFWEVDVYATPVELIGGAADVEVVVVRLLARPGRATRRL